MKLDYAQYQKISKDAAALKTTTKDIWYALAYPHFTAHPLETVADFWKITAFVYSWMPRIPNISPDHATVIDTAFIKRLQKLDKYSPTQTKKLFDTLVPVIDNSAIGVSKILHFIAPDCIPIYDNRVCLAWNSIFGGDLKLTGKNDKKALFYIEKMNEWRENCVKEGHDVSLRDIEKALFEYQI